MYTDIEAHNYRKPKSADTCHMLISMMIEKFNRRGTPRRALNIECLDWSIL
jgi:hypothetical protein